MFDVSIKCFFPVWEWILEDLGLLVFERNTYRDLKLETMDQEIQLFETEMPG